MTKLLVYLLVFSSFAFSSHHESTQQNRGASEADSEIEFNLRFFKSLSSKIRLLGEISLRDEEVTTFKSIRFGGYYRLLSDLKLGFFYSAQTGLLHDDDWTKRHESSSTLWGWKHTEDRIEQIFTADITYRKIIARNFIFELKNRYDLNSFNSHQYLRFRPGLNYLFRRDGLAFMNLFLQHETYHPLSGYSSEFVYEKWIYLGALYHLGQEYKIGGFVANRENHWESGLVSSKVFGVNFLVNL